MARKRNRRPHKIPTVITSDEIITEKPKTLQKYKIQFAPVLINPETGEFGNIHLFEQILPTLEEYSSVFGDDSMPGTDNYSEWLEYYIGFIKAVSPWGFVVMVDGLPQGLAWAINWASNGKGVHSVEISGLAKRGTNIDVTTQTIRKLVDIIFQDTDVYIIRASFTEDNRAASYSVGRSGFSHREKQRACMIRDGKEITGIIKSITRPEWEEDRKHG